MLQTSEIARLAIALIVLPFMFWYWRRLRLSSWGTLNLMTAAAVYLSYVVTIVEEYFLPDLLNAVQHGLLAVAGVCALLSAVYLARELRAAEGPGR